MKRKIILQNGKEFVGNAFGSTKEVIAEMVFDTSCVGYQEILSDPSYLEQIVVMTYPVIGNYGIIDEDYESKFIGPKAFIVREYNDKPSNFRYTKTLNELLVENDIPGITHVDTRMITRILRDEGCMLALICDLDVTYEQAKEKFESYKHPTNQVEKVSCKKKWYSRCANPKFNVVAIDCGVRYSIIHELNNHGCNVTIVPFDTKYESIMDMDPDGVVVSNGPGNPESLTNVIDIIKQLQGKKTLFGIGLGAQLIALANGMGVKKMKNGHHGSNHPIKNLESGKIDFAYQNHSYEIVNLENKNNNLKVSYIDLLDNTIEGFEVIEEYVMATQYLPVTADGPEDSHYMYARFVENMEKMKKEK